MATTKSLGRKFYYRKGGKVPFKNKKNKQDKDRVTRQSPHIHRSNPMLEIYLPSCPLGGVNSCASTPLSSYQFMNIICNHASSPPFSLLLTSVSLKLPGSVEVVEALPSIRRITRLSSGLYSEKQMYLERVINKPCHITRQICSLCQ